MLAMFIDAERSGYTPDQVYTTMTVGELAELFSRLARQEGDDMRVYLRHDDGYTYGGITGDCIEIEEVEEEE